MSRSGLQRVADILDAAARVAELVGEHDKESFGRSPSAAEAVAYNLVVIGEAAGQVPAELVQAHPEIPWHPMRGMRNVLVHEYFHVDAEMVWKTATVDLPAVVVSLRALLPGDAG